MSLCFLLTAGQGTRLKPYSDQIPKPAIPFLNLPLSYYGFYLAQQAGFDNFLLNKHHLPEQIESLAKNLSQFSNNVDTIDETQNLLGSGGAIWNAREIIAEHDSFMIANGDEVLIAQNKNPLKELQEKFSQDQPLCTLLTCDHPELMKTLKPVWVDSAGDVVGFGMEKPKGECKPVHYTGYKIFSKDILNLLPEGESNIFYDVLTSAIVQGKRVSTCHLTDSSWHETGNFQSLLTASQSVARENWRDIKQRREFFKKSPLVKIDKGNSLLIHPAGENLSNITNYEGTVVIGSGCLFATGTTLKNVFAFDGAHTETNSNHSNCMLIN